MNEPELPAADSPARPDHGPPADVGAASAAPRGLVSLLSFGLTLLLALGGAALAALLVRQYLATQLGDLAGGLFCGGGGRFDCARVEASEAASLLGFPVALWGFVFYAACAMLAVGAWWLEPAERAAAAAVGFTLALAALVFDVYLAWQMVTQIDAICLNCVATYAINLLLALAFWRAERIAGAPPDTRALVASWRPPWLKLALVLLFAGLAGGAVGYTWKSAASLRADARRETEEFLDRTRRPPEIDMTRFAHLPARGPAEAPITIVVAGDFKCHFCRALSGHVERLRRELPHQVRVVFLDAPVDPHCNPRIKYEGHKDACWLAAAGAAAAEQGKFWEYHDYLFHTLPLPQVTRANVERHFADIGLDAGRMRAALAGGRPQAAVAAEVALADTLHLYDVPSIAINGYPRRAGVYPEMLRDVVHAMLRRM